MKVIPVILAGGAGTRLWPLSCDDKPKQFHNLTGDGTLLSNTIERLSPLRPEFYLIVTGMKYAKKSLDELGRVGVKGRILAEPYPRNTAAAVLYAATYLSKKYDNSIMLVLPADHHIKKREDFIRILKIAIKEAEKNKLVTIGLRPSYPETGYGYIKSIDNEGSIQQVDRFVEKPDIEKAREYLNDGNYYWNSGMFIWSTSVIIENFKRLMPKHYSAFNQFERLSLEQMESNEDEVWDIKERIFSSLDSISIDYGIMECADKRVVVPAELGWTDLGCWKSVDDVLDPDEDMNRTPVGDRVIFLDSEKCSVFTESRRVALVGLRDIVVVEAGSDILIMDKSRAQEVRRIVEIVKDRG
ncbi:MAG: sugar phosphate nucleotidyltransferase [Spirochaetota bacterium]|nr:sugar phosphate nucleotidyltransferase [Spirochaetota bacterium]